MAIYFHERMEERSNLAAEAKMIMLKDLSGSLFVCYD
jgi:hypothetical protein